MLRVYPIYSLIDSTLVQRILMSPAKCTLSGAVTVAQVILAYRIPTLRMLVLTILYSYLKFRVMPHPDHKLVPLLKDRRRSALLSK